MAQKILICDDQPIIHETLGVYLESEGFEHISAMDGAEALELANSEKPDLILLDINLPDLDGLSICEKIRDFVSCPIIFLTARIEDGDKIRGFAAGGDDYVIKPFSMDELGARVAAHLRRELRRSGVSEVRFDENLVIDYSARRIFYQGKELLFAKKEFDIIEYLSQHPGQVFDKETIYERVWSYDSEGESSVITEHIRRIRAKFSAAGAGSYIETVWGCGYQWAR